MSPSHLISDLSVASAVMSYEFLVSGGGTRSVSDTDDMQVSETSGESKWSVSLLGDREKGLHLTK